MQNRNFWVFLLLSATILLGWMGLQMLLPPPEQKQDDQAKHQSNKEPPPKDSPKKPPEPEQPEITGPIEAKVWVEAASALSIWGGEPVFGVVSALAGAEKKTETAEHVTKPPETIALGKDDFYLNVLLTTRGAGVQKLTLSRFKAASWEGRPEDKALDLIPEDTVQPSFLMYHYPQPDLNDPDPNKVRPSTLLGDRVWQLKEPPSFDSDTQTQTVVFTTPGPPGYEYLQIRKTYTLQAKAYHVGLKLEIEDVGGKSGSPREPFRYQLTGAHGLPIEGEWYTSVYRNAFIGVVDKNNSLWRTMEDANRIDFLKGGSQVPSAKGPQDGVQYAAVATQYFASAIAVSNDQPEPRSILAYARATLESEEHQCFYDGKFANGTRANLRVLGKDGQTMVPVTLLPRAQEDLDRLKPVSGDELIVNMYTIWQDGGEVHVAEGFRQGTVTKPFLSDITVRVVSEPFTVSVKETKVHQYVLYHGPIKVRQLDYVSDKAGPVDPELVTRYADTLHLVTLTDYPSVSFFAWWSDIIIFCTRIMHWMLDTLYHIVPIGGVTIILLTVIVRGMMFPISRKQAMTAMRMQELAPEVKKLQEKYKNDVQARNQAMMELYRKHNVNPLGGCLPLLLQLPIFLGLYFALQESIRFRLAPFLWMDNLAAPDMLIYWGQHIPLISNPDNQPGGAKGFFGGIASMFYLGPYFNLLPVVAVTLMLVSQKMMMPPAQDEQQEMQQKMMTYMMVFIGIMFYKVAAGLSIYFIATTLWGIAERRFLPKKKPAVGPAPPETATPGKPGQPKDTGKPQTPAQRRKQRGKGKKQQAEEPDTAIKKVRSWWEEVLKQAKKK